MYTTPMGLLVACLGQISAAIAVFLDKIVFFKFKKDSFVVGTFSGITAFLIGFLILVLRGFPPHEPGQLIAVIASGFFLFYYLIPYFLALSKDDASRVVPLFQFTPIFTLITSHFVFGETLLLKQYCGFLLIILSGFLISLERIKKTFILRPALFLMLTSCAFLSLAFILIRSFASSWDFFDIVSYQSIGIAAGVASLLSISTIRKKVKLEIPHLYSKSWLLLFLGEWFNLGYHAAMTYALLLSPASFVSLSESFQPLVIFLGAIFLTKFFPHILQEETPPRMLIVKLVSIAIIALSLYLIYL